MNLGKNISNDAGSELWEHLLSLFIVRDDAYNHSWFKTNVGILSPTSRQTVQILNPIYLVVRNFVK